MNAPVAITLPHATAAVAAAIWAITLVMRWRKIGTERKILSTIGVLVLAAFAAGLFSYLPRPEAVLEDIAGALGKWTYLLVGVLAFLETGAFVGLVAPGEAAVVVGGVVAGQGEIDIRLLIGIVWFAALAGDTVSYFVGKRLGRDFLVKHGARLQITEARLVQVEDYMHRHGGMTILIGRFIGLVRALAPFIAGASHMPYRRFLPYDVIGSGLWAAFFSTLGYIFSQRLAEVIHYAERGVLIFGWTVGTIVVTVVLVKRFRQAEERAKLVAWLDEQERTHPRRAKLLRPLRRLWDRAVMPLARWLAPKVRFGWDRLTPGGLGIEFTTAAAAAIVAGYTYYFFLVAALDWPNNEFANRLNDAAFRIADSLRTDWIDELARTVTNFGALPVAGSAVAVATALCLWRRRYPEAIMLTVSLLITVMVVQTTKHWTEVPRPTNPMATYDGFSFPSGHAAYATVYVTIALTLERIGLIVRAALLVTAIVLGGAVALSRVYLRVHYMTDAIGGTALGFLSAAFVSGVVLIALHIRDTRRESASKVN